MRCKIFAGWINYLNSFGYFVLKDPLSHMGKSFLAFTEFLTAVVLGCPSQMLIIALWHSLLLPVTIKAKRYRLAQQSSSFRVNENHLEALLRHRLLRSTPGVSDLVSLGRAWEDTFLESVHVRQACRALQWWAGDMGADWTRVGWTYYSGNDGGKTHPKGLAF
jgi:hypothetical protein